MQRDLRRIPGRLARPIVPRLLGLKTRPDLVTLGNPGAAWTVPTSLLDEKSVVYSGGVGEDTSFDLELIERFGCTVEAFDPTPRAAEHARTVMAAESRFRFTPVGLWDEDATLRFYEPRDPAHVSHSALNLQGTDHYFEARVRPLSDLMAERGHESIDLLKIDIEGAEHAVIADILRGGIRPGVLCVEFDQPVSPRKPWATGRALRAAGYVLVHAEGWDHTYVRRG